MSIDSNIIEKNKCCISTNVVILGPYFQPFFFLNGSSGKNVEQMRSTKHQPYGFGCKLVSPKSRGLSSFYLFSAAIWGYPIFWTSCQLVEGRTALVERIEGPGHSEARDS